MVLVVYGLFIHIPLLKYGAGLDFFVKKKSKCNLTQYKITFMQKPNPIN